MPIESPIHNREDNEREPTATTARDALPTSLLTKAAEEAARRVARLKERLAALQSSIAAAQEEERLLSRVLAVRRGEQYPTASAPSQSAAADRDAVPGTDPGPGRTLLESVVAILERAGRPLHISELMRLLTEQNVPIPGSGNQANVISYLRRDGRIARPTRGIYGLRGWGLQDMAPAPRKRKRKRRRKTARRAQT